MDSGDGSSEEPSSPLFPSPTLRLVAWESWAWFGRVGISVAMRARTTHSSADHREVRTALSLLRPSLFFLVIFVMESNLLSRVAEFEAGYLLPFVFFSRKPALSFSVGCLQSGGWCLASFVEYGWSVRFVILFPGAVCGERKGSYYSVSCCGVMSWFLSR